MRYYSSNAGEMELQADITSASISMSVDSTTGLPGTTPFTLVIDPGNNEEIVDVTNVSGLNLTITRGVDGSPAQAHTAGVKIRHMATARDFREAQEHINDTSTHGVTSALVGKDDVQTLTNKNLTSGTNTFPSSLATTANLNAHTAATAAHGALGAVVGTSNAQALTNKDLSSASNTFPSSLATDAELSAHTGSTAAHGATGAVVGTTNTQTLTNKTMSGSDNTFSNIPQSAVSGLTSALSDTGWVSTGFTMASGWTNGGCVYRIKNGWCMVMVRATRSGGTLTASSTGDLGDTQIVRPPNQAQSNYMIVGSGNVTATSGNYHFGYRAYPDNGYVTITSSLPNKQIINGDYLFINYVFPV